MVRQHAASTRIHDCFKPKDIYGKVGKMIQIMVVGIHNNNERTSSLKVETEKFVNNLKEYNIMKNYIYWQPNDINVSAFEILNRYWSQFKVESSQRKLLEVKKLILARIPINIFRIIIRLFHLNIYKLQAYKEMSLAKKHLLAYELFINSEAEYLIVFEDDVMYEENTGSMRDFKEIINQVFPVPLYIDLAGGIQINDLLLGGLNRFKLNENKNYIIMDKLMTNTTCAYMINRSMAEHLYQMNIEKISLVRRLPIDWILNSFFQTLQIQGKDFFSVHFVSKFLKHGSKEGFFNSAIRIEHNFDR